jgi:hypothetical protein
MWKRRVRQETDCEKHDIVAGIPVDTVFVDIRGKEIIIPCSQFVWSVSCRSYEEHT